MNTKQKNFQRRRKRVRSKIAGTVDKPRLSVFRSGKYIYAQLIDDVNGKSLAAVSTKSIKKDNKTLGILAFDVGENLANMAKKRKISKVAFDKSGYKYHGAIKQLAEGARKGGLIF